MRRRGIHHIFASPSRGLMWRDYLPVLGRTGATKASCRDIDEKVPQRNGRPTPLQIPKPRLYEARPPVAWPVLLHTASRRPPSWEPTCAPSYSPGVCVVQGGGDFSSSRQPPARNSIIPATASNAISPIRSITNNRASNLSPYQPKTLDHQKRATWRAREAAASPYGNRTSRTQ